MADFQNLQQRESRLKQTQDHETAAPTAEPLDLESADLVELQSVLGNQSVQRMLGRRRDSDSQPPVFIQTKMSVGPANDQYEQEADRVADQVMTMPEKAQRQEEDELQTKRDFLQRQDDEEELQTKRDFLQRQDDEEELQMKRDFLQRQAEEEEEEEEIQASRDIVQRAGMDGGFDIGGSLEDRIRDQKGGGQSLPDSARTMFEDRFGRDFGDVRVHHDAQSDALNRSIQARAFTTGKDIFFKQGDFSPSSEGGQRLIAHELTHVIQQNGDEVKRKSPEKDERRS